MARLLLLDALVLMFFASEKVGELLLGGRGWVIIGCLLLFFFVYVVSFCLGLGWEITHPSLMMMFSRR